MPSPLDLVELPFMRTALVELALLAVAGGLVGAWIVLWRQAFFAHAAGTATFPGLVAADASGVSPTIAALAVALGYAGGVERAGRLGRAPGEAATAILIVAALAVGVVLASDVFESGGAVDRLLFGTLLGLDGADLALSGAAAVLAAIATVLLGRSWTALSFDPEGATALGLPAARAELLLLTLIRLSLNVASTRLVLMHGHDGVEAAGHVIMAFGQFGLRHLAIGESQRPDGVRDLRWFHHDWKSL